MGDATQLEIELLRTRERVRALEEVLQLQSEALKESSRLLCKSRPPRPSIPHDKKLLIAAEQHWKCADPFGECIMYKLSDGTFSAAGGLFECDHVDPYHQSFCSTRLNLRCVCITCHNMLCRRQRLSALEAAAGEGEGKQGEGDGEHAAVEPMLAL